MRRYDGQPEDGRRGARRATIKHVEGAPKRELPEEPGKSQVAKAPDDETLLIAWLCQRIDDTVPRKDDRAFSKNVVRSNLAALLHGRYEGDPAPAMTVIEIAEYAAETPADLDLELLREKVSPRVGYLGWHAYGRK
jgi:hypothetical protein